MAETSPGSVSRQREFIATALPEIAATFVDIPGSSFCFFSGFHGSGGGDGGGGDGGGGGSGGGRSRGGERESIRRMAFDAMHFFEIRRSLRDPSRTDNIRRDVLTNDSRHEDVREIFKSLDRSSSNDLCSECRNLREFFGVQLSLFSYIVVRISVQRAVPRGIVVLYFYPATEYCGVLPK